MSQQDTERKKALELAIRHIKKQFGEGAIMSLASILKRRELASLKQALCA